MAVQHQRHCVLTLLKNTLWVNHSFGGFSANNTDILTKLPRACDRNTAALSKSVCKQRSTQTTNSHRLAPKVTGKVNTAAGYTLLVSHFVDTSRKALGHPTAATHSAVKCHCLLSIITAKTVYTFDSDPRPLWLHHQKALV